MAFAALFSCTKETPAPVPDGDLVQFRATLEAPTVKTALAEGNTVTWVSGDSISIFNGSTNVFCASSGAGASTTFSATLSGSGPWYALYPYSADASISGGIITASLPSVQKAVPGTFANGLNLSVALSAGNELHFKNVLSYVKVQVTNNLVSKIVLSGKNSEVLAGTVNIDYNSGQPVYSIEGEGATTITLAPESGFFTPGEYYYIGVLPQTIAGGFNLCYVDAFGEEHPLASSSDAQLGRSGLLNIGSPDHTLALDGPIVFADPDVKADLLAKGIGGGIVSGEIYKSEAAAVSYETLAAFDPTPTTGSDPNKTCGSSSLWTDPTTIDSFDELKYFVGLTDPNGDIKLPILFSDCTNLVSVTLPHNLTLIANFCFKGCTSLKGIDLPENLRAIYQYTFSGCTAFSGIFTIPASVKSISGCAFMTCSADTILVERGGALKTISGYAFYNCTNLKRFEAYDNVIEAINSHAFSGCKNMLLATRLYTSLKTIGTYAFENCAKIKYITITSPSLETISRNAFYRCTSLINVYVSSSVKLIDQFSFSGCYNMTGFSYVKSGDTGLKLPEGLTTIGKAAFGGCAKITSVEFPSTISSIGDNVFRSEYLSSTARIVNLESWTVKAAAVPSLGANPFLKATNADAGDVTSILVPTASLDAYKAATNWSAFASVMSGF